MRDDLDGLMGRAVLAKTDGVVSGDPDSLVVAEGGQTDSAGSVGDKVL